MGSDSVISTRDICRDFRKNPTEAEALLWESLRNRQIFKLKFRRQYPIEGFILDFYCPEVKLGIEIDGKFIWIMNKKCTTWNGQISSKKWVFPSSGFGIQKY